MMEKVCEKPDEFRGCQENTGTVKADYKIRNSAFLYRKTPGNGLSGNR